MLLAIATYGLFGNFVQFFSAIFKSNGVAGYQVIGALMLLSGVVMFFYTSLEVFTRLTDYTWSVIFGVGAAMVWGELWRCAKSIIATSSFATNPVLLCTLCTIALLPLAKPIIIAQLSDWQLACLIFCGLNTLVGYDAAEAMARW